MRALSLLMLTLVATSLGKQVRDHGYYLRKDHSEVNLLKLLRMLQDKMEEKEMNINIDINSDERVRSGIEWEDCSQSNDLAEVLSVSFNPNPPEKGASFKVTTKTQFYQEVSGGNVYVNLKYLGYIPVVKETIDLCSLAKESGDSCPLTAGVHENYIESTFPDFSLSGLYTGTINAVDNSQNELSCIKIKFTI